MYAYRDLTNIKNVEAGNTVTIKPERHGGEYARINLLIKDNTTALTKAQVKEAVERIEIKLNSKMIWNVKGVKYGRYFY